MKRVMLCVLLFVLILFVSCSNDCGVSAIEPDGISEMISNPTSSIALVDMSSPNMARGPYDSYFLTTQEASDYIPLLFKSNNDKIISITVDRAVTFEHYLICHVTGLVNFKNHVDCDNINNFISENNINTEFYSRYFDSTILIDLYSGKVVDLGKYSLMNTVGFDEEYIYMTTPCSNDSYGFRILKISKQNLNSAQFITSDLESAKLQYVVGDYIVSGGGDSVTKAYLKDDSEKPVNINMGPHHNSPIFIPRENNPKYFYTFSTEYIEYDPCLFLEKRSSKKGEFGKILGKIQVDNINTISFSSMIIDNIDGILLPYSNTVEYDEYYNQNNHILYSSSKWDLKGNTWFEYDMTNNFIQLCYLIEDASEFGCHIEKVDSDLTPLFNMKYSEGAKAVLNVSGVNIYFVDNDDHVVQLNALTGETVKSKFSVDIFDYDRRNNISLVGIRYF